MIGPLVLLLRQRSVVGYCIVDLSTLPLYHNHYCKCEETESIMELGRTSILLVFLLVTIGKNVY